MTAARKLQGVGAGTITDSGTVPGRSPSGLRLLGSPAFSGGGVTTGGCVVLAEDGSGSRCFTYSPHGATQVAGMRRRVGEQKEFSFSARVDAFPVYLTNGMAIDALPRCGALLCPALPALSSLYRTSGDGQGEADQARAVWASRSGWQARSRGVSAPKQALASRANRPCLSRWRTNLRAPRHYVWRTIGRGGGRSAGTSGCRRLVR